MKIILFAAALTLGGAAMAQDSGQMSTTTTTTSSTATMSNGTPERDARGIPVVSADAMAPGGWNQGPHEAGTGTAPSTAPMPAAGDLPPCSRTVTDRCTQTYERGVRKPR
jgi:hypothetical protein